MDKHDESTSTLSHVVKHPPRDSKPQPHLFLVLRADYPLASSVRYALENVEELVFGRALEDQAPRLEELDHNRFKLIVPDRWMSSSHARLSRAADHWTLQDAGSKNGTFVNGLSCESTALSDGDLIELGHTFFIFREAMPTTEHGPRSLDTHELRPAASLATLVPKLQEQFAKLEAIAPSPVSVVIHGESGTGKELVAQAIHNLSRRSGALVAVNCAALPQTLVESELFGYRKGAFSGATEDRTGLIRSADHGTLFLDEIGDLPASAQAVFLRVLQESEVVPVGATRPVKVDIRLLAATHRDLEALVAENRFRADLLARIAGFTLWLPTLRERREDLGLLIGVLLRRHFSDRAERISFSSEAARAILLYNWPLNVRELEKCLTAAVVLARFGTVEEAHLPGPLRAWAREGPAADTVAAAGEKLAAPQLSESDQRRRDDIVALLREHNGNITSVARALGKGRFQVQRWIKRYRIDTKDFRR
jgi:DNA-binding NtrC family response regulator